MSSGQRPCWLVLRQAILWRRAGGAHARLLSVLTLVRSPSSASSSPRTPTSHTSCCAGACGAPRAFTELAAARRALSGGGSWRGREAAPATVPSPPWYWLTVAPACSRGQPGLGRAPPENQDSLWVLQSEGILDLSFQPLWGSTVFSSQLLPPPKESYPMSPPAPAGTLGVYSGKAEKEAAPS